MTLPSVESMQRLAAADPKLAAVALLMAYLEARRLLADALVDAERLAEQLAERVEVQP